MLEENLIRQVGLTTSQEAASAQRAPNDLGQEDFLRLLSAQLQAQDPLEPQEGGDFLGQLAQFSTVSGIDQLNATFGDFGNAFLGTQSLQASNLVGRDVLTETGAGFLSKAGTLNGAIDLPFSALNTQIKISDSSGQLVRTLNLGTLPGGQTQFQWDGKTDNGAQAPAGNYNIEATGNVGGRIESIPVLAQARVQSVNIGSGNNIVLNLDGLGPVPFSEISQIQ